MWAVIRQWLVKAVESRGTAAFLSASLVVGILVGLGAAVLVLSIGWVVDGVAWVRRSLDAGTWIVLLTVPAGLVVSWSINRRWGPGVDGGGVSETMLGLALHGGYLPTRTIGAKIAATAATLGSGGSAGREGPIAQIGATIGSSFARYTRFGEDQIRSLVAAGAGAGIAASFNTPIAGMLFAMEVILGNFAIRHVNSVVVAAVAASVTARELVGAERLLSSPSHALGHPAELALYALLGVLAAGLGLGFVLLTEFGAGLKSRYPGFLRPVLGGLGVAVLILIEPALYGSGQEYLSEVLRLDAASSDLWVTFAAIAALKTVAAALTFNSGGSGGSMMPNLVMGGSLGAALALLVGPVWTFSSLEPGAFAVVGMAATFAAGAQAPLTSIILVFEITGDYNLVLPLMLAASLGTFVYDRFQQESEYTMPLVRRGVRLTKTEDIDLLDTVTVGDVMTLPDATLPPAMLVGEATAVMDRDHHHGLPVVDRGRLVGIVTISDLEGVGESQGTQLAAVMTADPITVFPGMPVSAALARMASLGVGRLPVVAEDTPDRYVGMFRRESVVRAYHQALGATTERELYRERLRARRQPGAGFFELPIPPSSAADGFPVSEIEWPESATLVSVRRGTAVLIPHGDTVLRTGDTLTAFGSGEARVELAYLLEPTPPSGSNAHPT